jgi:NADPH:quinone reductase-like Zn-dependent oxidoreductase
MMTTYGPPDVLRLVEVERPTPKDDEVLVAIHASSINSWDLDLLNGRAQFTLGGRLKPRYEILGCDIAGRVEDIGSKVEKLRPGDEVFGDISRNGWGGFAEFVCVKEKALSRKPSGMSFEQAAVTPQAAVLALQGLRKGGIQAGESVLINGAGGGVGSFGIQLAKFYGAEVTGVDSSDKVEVMIALGANHVLDYAHSNFTASGRTYDLIIDIVAQHSLFDYRRALRPKGKCVVIGGSARTALQALFFGSLILGTRKVKLLLHKPQPDDLDTIAELIVANKVVPVIDRTYTLEEVPEAFRYFALGHVKGKIAIKIR